MSVQVSAIAKRRGPIKQTKGMLMLVYDIDEDAAFNILKSLSQVRNVKLVRIAEQIGEDFRAVSRAGIPSHVPFDRALFTAHPRVDRTAID